MIDIHPDSSSQTLVVTATGTLTARDYELDFIPAVEDRLARHTRINLVLHLDEFFEGWELGAMWDDARFGLRHRHDFQRVAVVGAQAWFKWAMQLGSIALDGEFRTFDAGQVEAAVNWARASSVPESVR